MIAGRHQEHRHRPGHDDRVQYRLVAVAVHHHDVARGHRRVPHDLVRRRGPVRHEKQVVGVEDPGGVPFRRRDRARVVKQLSQFVHRVADIGPQHVFAEELVEHLPHGRLQKRHPARVPGAMPRIRPVVRVVHQRPEKRRGQRVEVAPRLAGNVPRHKFGSVLEHVDEPVQFLQHIDRNVPAGAGFAIQKNRDLGVPPADLLDKLPQIPQHRLKLFGRPAAELFVVDRKHECRGPALLLCERRHVAIAGDSQHFQPLVFDRLRQGPNPQATGVFRTKILVDDDDRKTRLHGESRWETAACLPKQGHLSRCAVAKKVAPKTLPISPN